MRPGTLLRLALAGSRTDTLRVALTAVSAALATLALLAAATVAAIPRDGHQPGGLLIRQPGLRPWMIFWLVLLVIPVLGFAAQCSRLGAPARDRRLAGIRLAGATPGQALAVVAAETGLASGVGSALALAVYLVGRRAADRPEPDSWLAVPAAGPAWWTFLAICLGVPALATATAVLLLRRVRITPFGVVRRPARAPRPWPAGLVVVGIAGFAEIKPVVGFLIPHDRMFQWVALFFYALGAVVISAVGVALSGGWLSYGAGRLLHRLARRPAALLAARRLMAEPWATSRNLGVLLVAVIFGAGAVAVRIGFVTRFAEEDEFWSAAQAGQAVRPTPHNSFYFHAVDLADAAVMVAVVMAAAGLLVALAEGIVARRRAYASLVATGVPRSVLARSILWQAMAPAVPTILLALTVGEVLVRSFEPVAGEGDFARTVPVPWGSLAWLGGEALLAVLVATSIGLVFLRSSTALEEIRAG